MKQRYTYPSLLVVLTALSGWQALTFTFWKDDWLLLWSALNHIETFRAYWIHPATVIEFMWLTPIFGTNPLPWQIFGLMFRWGVGLSLAFFTHEITGSRMAALLSGVFIAVSVAGIDAAGWPSAHVVLLSSIFLLVGLSYLLRYLKKGKEKDVALCWLYLGIGFFLDPIRNFPVFLIIPSLYFCLHGPSVAVRLKKFCRLIFLLLLGIGTIIFVLFRKDMFGSQLFSHVSQNLSLLYILKKVYLVGNYFNSLLNLVMGWMIRFPEDGSTGIYNPMWARAGFLIFAAGIGMWYAYLQLKSRTIGVYLFSLIWIFVFYLPNWLFEPRLTMGITHRYMELSNIGVILFVAWGISQIKKRSLRYTLAALFVVLNVLTSWHYLAQAETYRSASVVNAFWTKIDADVPPSAKNLIFAFSGEDPVKTYALSLSGGYPFALRRHITDSATIPVVTADRTYIEKLLCADGVPLNHLFAWNVKNDGTIISVSLPTRREILVDAMDHDCVPLIDPAM